MSSRPGDSLLDLFQRYRDAFSPFRPKVLDPNAPGASEANPIGLEPLVVTAPRSAAFSPALAAALAADTAPDDVDTDEALRRVTNPAPVQATPDQAERIKRLQAAVSRPRIDPAVALGQRISEGANEMSQAVRGRPAPTPADFAPHGIDPRVQLAANRHRAEATAAAAARMRRALGGDSPLPGDDTPLLGQEDRERLGNYLTRDPILPHGVYTGGPGMDTRQDFTPEEYEADRRQQAYENINAPTRSAMNFAEGAAHAVPFVGPKLAALPTNLGERLAGGDESLDETGRQMDELERSTGDRASGIAGQFYGYGKMLHGATAGLTAAGALAGADTPLAALGLAHVAQAGVDASMPAENWRQRLGHVAFGQALTAPISLYNAAGIAETARAPSIRERAQATADALRERTVARGTPVVDRPATPETLREAVDRIPPAPEQRVRRVEPMGPDVTEFRQRSTDELEPDMAPEARRVRAAEQGFDTGTTFYTGLRSGTSEPVELWPGTTWLTESPERASFYAEPNTGSWRDDPAKNATHYSNGQVIPTFVRGRVADFSTRWVPNGAGPEGGPGHVFKNPDSEALVDELFRRVVEEGGPIPAPRNVDRATWKGDPAAQRQYFRQILVSPSLAVAGRQMETRVINALRGMGYDGLRINFPDKQGTQLAIFDPKNVRSIFARFDPANADKPGLSGAALPRAVTALGGAGVGAAGGAAADEDNPLRGAIIGGVLGGALGTGAGTFIEGRGRLSAQAGERAALREGARRYAEGVEPVPPLTPEMVDAGQAVLPHRFDPALTASIERDPATGGFKVVERGGRRPRVLHGPTDLATAEAVAHRAGFASSAPATVSRVANAPEAVEASGQAMRRMRDPRPLRGPEPTPHALRVHEPIPLPPLHPDMDPALVKPAWDVVSSRYPRLASLVRGIEPLPPELEAAAGGARDVAAWNPQVRTLHTTADVPLSEQRLFHEFAHVAQTARGKLHGFGDLDPATLAELEDYAYRVQKAYVDATAARYGADGAGISDPLDRILYRGVYGMLGGGLGGAIRDPEDRAGGALRGALIGGLLAGFVPELPGAFREGGALRNERGMAGPYEPGAFTRRDLPSSLRRMPSDMNPTEQRAWIQGEDAAGKGLSRDVNNLPEGSPEWHRWEQGWRGAQPRQRGAEFSLRDNAGADQRGAIGDSTPPPLPHRTVDDAIATLRQGGDLEGARNLEHFMNGSRVRRVVFHGTNKSFDSFDAEPSASLRQGHAWDRLGIWFTDEPRIASNYANRSWRGESEGGQIYPVFLSLKNPLEIDYNDILGANARRIGQLRRRATEAGHDGFALRRFAEYDGEGYDYVVFRPEQVKSATGNSGAFDPSNPSIRGAVGPESPGSVARQGANNMTLVTGMAGAGLGGAYGYTQGDDPQERLRNALLYGAGGAVAGGLLPHMVADVMPGGRAANEVGAFNPRGIGLERFTDGELRAMAQRFDGDPVQEQILAELRSRDDALRQHAGAVEGVQADATRADIQSRRPDGRRYYAEPLTEGKWRVLDGGTGEVVEPSIGGFDGQQRANAIAQRLNREAGVSGELPRGWALRQTENGTYRFDAGNGFWAGGEYPSEQAAWEALPKLLRIRGMRPDAGAVPGAVVRGMAGAGTGALVGAAVDDENPVEGALAGAVAGLGVGLAPEVYGVARRVLDERTSNVLSGTRVVDEAGAPRIVYHGTDRGFRDFSRLSPKEANLSLYGPGYYFTERPEIASGYAGFDDGTISGVSVPDTADTIRARIERYRSRAADPAEREYRDALLGLIEQEQYVLAHLDTSSGPNVRPARLAIKSPFDIDAELDRQVAERLVALAERAGRRKLDVQDRTALLGEHGTNGDLYYALWRIVGNKAKVNRLLRSEGYDGITHIGGGRTGNEPHRVWIAFDRSQIRSAFGPAEDAAQAGAASGSAVRGLAGAGTGAVIGAATDDEDRARGAALGAVAGLGVGLAPEVLASARRVAGNDVGAVGLRRVGALERFEPTFLKRRGGTGVEVTPGDTAIAAPERALGEAMRRAVAEPDFSDLPALASGTMAPEAFAVKHGVDPAVAQAYADHVQTLRDPDGYTSPLDDPAAAYARPERDGEMYTPQGPPEPPTGPPDDGFIPPDQPEGRFGSGGGQEGLRFFPLGVAGTLGSSAAGSAVGAGIGALSEPDDRTHGAKVGATAGALAGALLPGMRAVSVARRADLLTNVSGIGRDLAQNAAPTETAATMIAAPLDRVARMYSGQRSVALRARGLGEAAYRGVTTGFADMGRKVAGRPVSETGGRAAERAASLGVEGADRRVLHSPIWDRTVRLIGRIRGSVDMPAAVAARTRAIDSEATVQAFNEGLKGRAMRARADELKAASRRLDSAYTEAAREGLPDWKATEARAVEISGLSPETAEVVQAMHDTADLAVATATFTNDSFFGHVLQKARQGVTEFDFPGVPQGIQQVGRDFGAGAFDFFAPFKRVPPALAGYTLQMSPAAALTKVPLAFVQWFKAVHGGADAAEVKLLQRTMTMSAGRVGVGTGIIMGGAMLAKSGRMAGANPTPQQKSSGATPYSVYLDGQWIPVAHLPPIGPLLGLGADLQEGEGVWHSGSHFAENVGEMTLLRGVGDVQNLLGLDGDRKFRQAINSAASSFVPTIVGQVAQGMDGVRRAPENPWQAIESRIPVLSERVPAKEDPFGNPVRTGPGGLGGALRRVMDFTRSNPALTDPVLERLSEQGVNVSQPRRMAAETPEQTASRLAKHPRPKRRRNETAEHYQSRVATWGQPRRAETDAEYRARVREIGADARPALAEVMGDAPPKDSRNERAWHEYHNAESWVRQRNPRLSPEQVKLATTMRRRDVLRRVQNAIRREVAEARGDDPAMYEAAPN